MLGSQTVLQLGGATILRKWGWVGSRPLWAFIRSPLDSALFLLLPLPSLCALSSCVFYLSLCFLESLKVRAFLCSSPSATRFCISRVPETWSQMTMNKTPETVQQMKPFLLLSCLYVRCFVTDHESWLIHQLKLRGAPQIKSPSAKTSW